MKHKSNNPTVKRLYELSALLSAQCHARGGNSRAIMVELMTEYDELKNSNREAWDEYCRLKHNLKHEEHTQYY